MRDFIQAAPTLANQYSQDPVLQAYLERTLPAEILQEIQPDLRQLGERVCSDILELGKQAENAPPKHIPYDAWGRRIDVIETSEAWKKLDQISAQEGLVAIGYERKHGAYSRIHQFAKLYLFGPSSAIYTCPLAMTDGAARAIELYGDEALKSRAFRKLTSRDPGEFWTSGQWMTEKTGGSDVSLTSTIAKPLGDGKYSLHGIKWFTSATTSQMAMTLARIEGAPQGSAGLSLFYIELRDAQNRLQGIQVHRLKDKLGTKALPTAELTLEGTPAVLVGGEGGGVKKIASLFNITRIYNSICAVGYMRRALALARDYADKRQAFGKLLIDQPLHVETLAELEVEFEAAFHLVFRLVELLGKDELKQATAAESAVLRLLTPVAKLSTAKQAVQITSEVLECFGGAGYVEDTGLPSLLRDSQVLAIWEGTTNVLSLDALRALEKDQALEPFLAEIQERLGKVRQAELTASVERVQQGLKKLKAYLGRAQEFFPAGARSFALSLSRLYAASLLLESAEWGMTRKKDARPLAVAKRYCAKELVPLVETSREHQTESRQILG